MKKVFLSIFLLFVSTLVLFSQTEVPKIKLAVSKFNDTITRETEQNQCGNFLSSSLEKLYSLSANFQTRESGAISKYLDNLKNVQLGLTDDLLIKGQGNSLLVDYLVFGTVSSMDGKYNVDARVVNIDSWKIIKSSGTTCSSLDEAVAMMNSGLIESFTQAYLTDREKGMADSPTIAVYAFKDENPAAMNTRYSAVFVEMLNSVLGSFQQINTVERTYTKSLMQEKALEMSGVTENATVNRKDVMGIQYKLTGGFRVFKDVTTVNYKLENLSTGQVVYMGTRDIGSASALRRICESLSNIVADVLGNKIGTLKLDSTPSGAEVFIDDEPMGQTPLLVPVQKGEHTLLVKMDGYEADKSTIIIQAQSILEKKIKLEELSRKLLYEAFDLERKGDADGAIRLYDEFINTYGEATEVNEALYRKGHVLIGLKKYDEAVQTFSNLVTRYPDSLTRAEAYYGLAKAYYSMGNMTKATEAKDFLYEHFGETYTAEEAKRTFNW